jgi:1,6-anhydro-N-acetylmuramate kinase
VLVIGLMSGTSLDGIDAALVELNGAADLPDWRLAAFVEAPYSAGQRRTIHDSILSGTAASLCRLNADLGEWFAAAALRLCREAGVSARSVDAIGSQRGPARRHAAARLRRHDRRTHGYPGDQRFPVAGCCCGRRGRATGAVG